MLEQLKYINHLGEELHFGRDGLYVNENDLRDFVWSVSTVNNRISGFNRTMQTKSLPVRILCVSRADGIIKRNALFEIPERDVLANTPGKLWLNGYYLECFITGSKKDRYSISEQYMAADLTVVTDRPVWVRETEVQIKKDTEWEFLPGTGLDFPYGFDYDLGASGLREDTVVNDSAFESAFRMVIHGLAVNPTVTINGHLYQVNVTVDENSTLTIDSGTKKIYLTKGSEETNAFDARNRDEYIFEPIPSGNLEVSWDNTFDIDLFLLEERSEPKWRKEVR